MPKVNYKLVSINFNCIACNRMIITTAKSFERLSVKCDHCGTEYKVDLRLSYSEKGVVDANKI